MAKTKRLYEVAKELGVASKAIVEKCQAEGVPGIENHMSQVKLGLVETIREWFRGSAAHNAIETAERVDLDKARKGVRRRKARAGGEDEQDGVDSTATLTDDDTSLDHEHHEPAEGQPSTGEPTSADASAAPGTDEVQALTTPAQAISAATGADNASASIHGTAPTDPLSSTQADPIAAHELKPASQADAEPSDQAAPDTDTTQAQPTTEHARSRPTAPTVRLDPAQPATARPTATRPASSTSPVSPSRSPAGPSTVTPSSAPSSGQPARPTAQPLRPAARAPQVGDVAAPPPRTISPAGVPNVPLRPTVVAPAGERLVKPQTALLKGPKVVRVERPDALPAPRPRPAGGQSGSRPPSDGTVPGISRSRGPVRGRGAGPVPNKESEAEAAKRRRSANTRRGGRSADALLTGPAQLSEADLAELDAKLKGAGGYIKLRRQGAKTKGRTLSSSASPVQVGGKVPIEEPITIKSLSAVTGIKTANIIKHLLRQGIMANVNSAVDAVAAMEVALEYNIELEVKEQRTAAELIEQEFDRRDEVDVRPRPPIVTVLGHVDHGKTSLLDAIRKSDVASHEDGGITQHVGAYRVTGAGHDGRERTVVFLDTPGHEAFTNMRARGARMTDLVVLVVAADDGVMPQTIESISHAKAAGVSVVVALNKIDKPEVTDGNIRKILGQLAEHGLNPVEWGGDTEIVRTSAITGRGIPDLLEMLDYKAELLELTADYGGPARGTVIEAEMQEGRGPVARVLVQDGTLRVGDFICIGRSFGRVRDMTNDRGQRVREVGPATPVEISGIDRVPDAGDKLFVTESLQRSEEIATHYRQTERQRQLVSKSKVTLDNIADQIAAGQLKELRVVLKADVQGSIETLVRTLSDQGNDEVGVKVIHSAVGGINESDVLLADASDAIIIGFHVVAPAPVREIAEQRKVDIRLYRIIYEITDDVKAALEGMLAPDVREEEIGSAEVREVFKIGKLGTVAGCIVVEGWVRKSERVRLIRNNTVVTDNRQIEGLRRVKEDVSEVRAGTECGIRLVGFEDIKAGDRILCYKKTEVKRTLA